MITNDVNNFCYISSTKQKYLSMILTNYITKYRKFQFNEKTEKTLKVFDIIQFGSSSIKLLEELEQNDVRLKERIHYYKDFYREECINIPIIKTLQDLKDISLRKSERIKCPKCLSLIRRDGIASHHKTDSCLKISKILKDQKTHYKQKYNYNC